MIMHCTFVEKMTPTKSNVRRYLAPLCCVLLVVVIKVHWRNSEAQPKGFRRTSTFRTGVASVDYLSWSPNNLTVALGSYSQAIEVRDFPSLRLLWQLKNKHHWLVGFTQSDVMLETGNTRASFLWEPRTGKLKYVFKAEMGHLPYGTKSPYSLAVTKSHVVLKSVKAGSATHIIKLPMPSQDINQFFFSSDEKTLVGISDRTIVAWNIKSENKSWSATSNQGLFKGGVFLDNQTFVTISRKGTIELRNVQTGALKNSFIRNNNIRDIEFASNGKSVSLLICENYPLLGVVPHLSSTVKVIDIQSGKLVGEIAQQGKLCKSLSLSADGNQVALGMSDGTVEIWRRTSN